jgi:hypothetical protein
LTFTGACGGAVGAAEAADPPAAFLLAARLAAMRLVWFSGRGPLVARVVSVV